MQRLKENGQLKYFKNKRGKDIFQEQDRLSQEWIKFRMSGYMRSELNTKNKIKDLVGMIKDYNVRIKDNVAMKYDKT